MLPYRFSTGTHQPIPYCSNQRTPHRSLPESLHLDEQGLEIHFNMCAG